MKDKRAFSGAIVAAADKNYDEFKKNIEQIAEPRLFTAVKNALNTARAGLFKKE